MFEKAYGTSAIDGENGKVPQTLDFFVKLKQGQTFTFEIDATTDSSGRTWISDLAVASCRDKDNPFTEEQAQAYERYFDAVSVGISAIEEEDSWQVYDIRGIRLSRLQPGINIIRMDDGTVRKVMMK